MRKEKANKIFYHAGIYLIAAVLLFSGISKIIDPMPLIETLKLVAKLPEDILIIIATILPILEIGLGILLVLKIKPKPVLFATLALFAAFFVFSVYGTIIGLKNDCGCFGSVVKNEIGWGMVGRNGVLMIIDVLLCMQLKGNNDIEEGHIKILVNS
jgi:hypothetical protein